MSKRKFDETDMFEEVEEDDETASNDIEDEILSIDIQLNEIGKKSFHGN